MRKCIRCGAEMTEGFVLMQELAFLQSITLAAADNSLNKFGDLRAAVCPKCGEISLYTENDELVEEDEGEYVLCPECGYPVYEDETFCANCGKTVKEKK